MSELGLQSPSARTAAPAGAAAVTLAFCFAIALCEGLDVQAAGVAAGGIKAAFNPTPTELGLFLSAGNFGLLFGAVAGGRISDRVGRKAVLVASIALFGVFSVLTSFAWSMPVLIAARALTGLGLGGAMPNLIALAADISPERSRNGSVALTYVGMPFGGGIASAIILFAAPSQWRWVFLLGGLAPLIIAPLMAWLAPATPPAARETSADKRDEAGFKALFAGGRLQSTLLLWLTFLLLNLTLHLLLNWLPLLLQARGLSKSEAALAQVGFNAGGAAAAMVAGALLDTRWRRAAIGAGVIGLPLALALIAAASAQSLEMLILAVLLGCGLLICQVITYGTAGGVYPPAVRGAGIGAAVGVGRIGSLIGPTLGALLLAAGRSPTQILASVLPITLGAGLCVALLAWPKARAPAG